MAVKVGSFTKSTDTGVPVSQAVTGVGFKPRALILWTVGATENETWTDSYRTAVGFAARNAADTVTVGSVASASHDGQGTSNTSRRAAAKALTIVEWGESLLAECDLSSFDNDGFTLSWTTNNATGYIVHYMALGGTEMTAAYVKSWKTGTSTGNKAITGVGFQPSCVFHLSANTAGTGSETTAQIMIGAMTSAAQWCGVVRANDNLGTTSTRSVIENTKCIYTISSLNLVSNLATYVSMDADGFTVNFGTAGFDGQMYSLCLDGGSYAVGNFQKPTSAAPVTSTVSGLAFRPEGIWNSQVISALIGFRDSAYYALGATDGSAECASCLNDVHNQGTSIAKCYDTNAKIVAMSEDATPAVSAAADLSSINSDGFVFNWTTNHLNASYVFWFAFAGDAAGGSALLMQHYHHSEFHGGGHQ